MRLLVFLLSFLLWTVPVSAQPSDALFEKLRSATNDQDAAQPEADKCSGPACNVHACDALQLQLDEMFAQDCEEERQLARLGQS